MSLKTIKFISLIALTSSLFLLNGCVAKKSDGTYPSSYSYDPYSSNNNHDVRFEQSPTRYYEAYNHQQPRVVTYHQNTPYQIEKLAKSMLGTPYKYGANGPYRYDCSSFTKHIFSRQGIKIPRVSRDQAKVGKLIPRNYLKKGDLIFFDSKKSSRVSHVGIYLSHGRFIHASSSKHKVTISSLDSKYYREHFKWGRRVVPNQYNYASR